MKNEVQKHKSYSNMQFLSMSIYKWKDFSIDFVIGLLKSKN